MGFLNKVIKELDNEYAAIVSEGTSSGDCEVFIDTGSFVLNALISGSIYGGIPHNKITALAGESSTGKCARGNEKITIYCDKETASLIKSKLNNI